MQVWIPRLVLVGEVGFSEWFLYSISLREKYDDVSPAMKANLLQNITVINVGLNLPGPKAAQILAEHGATVIKIEPPTGDSFETISPEWYAHLHEGVTIHRINIKTPEGRALMTELLSGADILITSQRPSALVRMGLAPQELQQRFPRLSIVNIVGSPEQDAEIPGHDLTYQTKVGLVTPPDMPRTLIADLAGAQRAAITALALYIAGGGVREVALSDAAQGFSEPIQYALTQRGHFLGGGHAGYNIYATADGHIALAALEIKFWNHLRHLIPELPESPLDPSAQTLLKEWFHSKPTADWAQWARQHDIPLEAINNSQD